MAAPSADTLVEAFGIPRAYAGHTRDVRDFGAKGNGTSDDGTKFQAAVDSLVTTGGVVWVPPDRKYAIGTTVLVKSRLPIWIVSGMSGSGWGGDQVPAGTAKGVIKPLSGVTNIFEWDYVTAETDLSNTGGGGIRGLRFVNYDSTGRDVDFTSAVFVDAAGYFTAEDCNFAWLNASAIKCDQSTILEIRDCKIYRCGGTSKPTILAGDATNFCGLYMYDTFVETCYLAPYVKVAAASTASIHDCYFEATTSIADTNRAFVHGDTGTVAVFDSTFNANSATAVTCTQNFDSVYGCRFANTGTPMLSMSGQFSQLGDTRFVGGGQTGNAVLMSGISATAKNVLLYASGNLACTNQHAKVEAVTIDNSTTTQTANIKIYSGAVLNCTVDGQTANAAKGIQITDAQSRIIGNEVRGLNNATGIETSATGPAVVMGNYCHTLNGGVEFVSGAATDVFDGNAGQNTATELTIASGAITKLRYKKLHTVDTEADGASDDLNTINGVVAGDRFILRAENDGRSVVFKDGTGNIECAGGADLTLDNTLDYAECLYNGTKVIITLHDGGAWITPAERQRWNRSYIYNEMLAA